MTGICCVRFNELTLLFGAFVSTKILNKWHNKFRSRCERHTVAANIISPSPPNHRLPYSSCNFSLIQFATKKIFCKKKIQTKNFVKMLNVIVLKHCMHTIYLEPFLAIFSIIQFRNCFMCVSFIVVCSKFVSNVMQQRSPTDLHTNTLHFGFFWMHVCYFLLHVVLTVFQQNSSFVCTSWQFFGRCRLDLFIFEIYCVCVFFLTFFHVVFTVYRLHLLYDVSFFYVLPGFFFLLLNS